MKAKVESKKAYKKKLQSLNQDNSDEKQKYLTKKAGQTFVSSPTSKSFTSSTTKTSSEFDSIIGSDTLDWSSLTYSDKLKLFNEWTFVVIIGDLFQIFG